MDQVQKPQENTRQTNAFLKRMEWALERVMSAKNLDEIFIGARDRILNLIKADRIIIYCLDLSRGELYTRYLSGSEIREIRIPADPSNIAGYVVSTKRPVNIKDVYQSEELKRLHKDLQFDRSWDQKTGYRTKETMAAPIVFKDELLGVVTLINQQDGKGFSADELLDLQWIANHMGIAFKNKLGLLHPTRFSYLVENKIISHDALRESMLAAKNSDTPVETILMQDFKVSKEDIGASLSTYFGCKFVQYRQEVFLPGGLIKGINLNYLKKALWVPIAVSEGKVTIATDNPRDVKITEIPGLIRAEDFEIQVALKEDVFKFIEVLERGWDREHVEISEMEGELSPSEKDMEEERMEDGIDENLSAIVRLANQIIIDGFRQGASDIHIEPNKARKATEIRLRIDGICIKNLSIPYLYTNALISRLKILANLDISERRIPQDGKIKFKYKDSAIELRVATVPTVSGENVVMRILASSEPMPLEQANLAQWNYKNFKEIIQRPYGIILVVGPTGSGKTTTLHSALGHINTPEKKIWTAEDPVEITQPGLCQVEVKPKINYTFAAALRSFLRADPDVIMIGEMRDLETATIAIESSLTGHLVFSTLHTNTAPETVIRLIDIGIDPFNFADAILGILAQRLVRTFCKSCKEAYHPDEEEYTFFVNAYGGEALFSELNVRYTKRLKFFKTKGCEACNNTGYKGRTALHELLIGTKEIKMIIQKRGTADTIRAQAIKDGMRTLHQDGIAKVFKGQSDYQQVRNVCMV